MITSKTIEQLLIENEELRSRLGETEATLSAIRSGEVDAIVVSGADGEKIFTLTSAETPYRIIIEEMNEGAVTISEDGIILYCNRKFAQMVAMPMEQITGISFKQFVAENDKSKYETILLQGLAGKIKEEICFDIQNGETLFVQLSLSNLPLGMIGRICIIVTDITELKKHQQNLQVLVSERTAQLKEINERLKETNATKDKLFSIIAHDLRGPFTTLMGFSDLLIENLMTYEVKKVEQLLFHISSATRSAYALLENMLIWARSQNGQLSFNPVFIEIDSLLREIIGSLNAMALIKDIKLKYTSSGNITGYADENMLNAIVRNLVTNAIKFSNTGGNIEVRVISKHNEVEVMVSDEGVGMDEQTKNSLFEMNAKTSLAGTAHEKGTGLGLLICSEFVEKHNGKIWVESEEGRGSKFFFTLPHKVESEVTAQLKYHDENRTDY